MKNRFRFPALLLALMICLNLLPFAAFADDGLPYTVTVSSGKLADGETEGNYAEGSEVRITADAPETGKRFKEWKSETDLEFTSETDASDAAAVFTMPARPVTVTATYEDILSAPVTEEKEEPSRASFTVAVVSGRLAGGGTEGSYAEGDEVGIKADDPETGRRFKAWTSETGLEFVSSSAADASATFKMPAAAVTVTATYEDIPSAPVTEEKEEASRALSTVAVVSGRLAGGGTEGSYAEGDEVGIKADDPEPGKRFKEWTSETALEFVSSSATDASATFRMPAGPVIVTATYEEIPAATYMVKVVSGKLSGGETEGSYAAGSEVGIKADDPEPGKRFKEWTSETALEFVSSSAADASATFKMPAGAVTVTATYEEIPAATYMVKVVSGKLAGGETEGSYAEGSEVRITADAPETGKRFKAWTSGTDLEFISDTGSADASAVFKMPAGPVTVTATYENLPPETYTVTVSNDGNGTAKADPASGIKDDTVTLTATPNENYKFKEWQVKSGGVKLSSYTSEKATFLIGSSNVEVKAVFEEITYQVTVKDSTHGKVEVDKTEAPLNGTVTLTITPDTGFELDSLEVEDPAKTKIPVANNAFTMPKSNVTVTAVFKAVAPVSYSITEGANGAWIKGSGLTYTITAKRSIADKEILSHFTGVMIDSYILSITDYTVKEGSVKVTIKASAMQRLALGYHTITLYFDDGIAATRVYIWGNPGYPSTGDERQTALWATLTGVTAVGMGAIAVLACMYGKKKKKKEKQ